jgi:hypothetical protein
MIVDLYFKDKKIFEIVKKCIVLFTFYFIFHEKRMRVPLFKDP